METHKEDEGRRPAVLVVDDDRDVLWLMANMLKRGGYHVETLARAPSMPELEALDPDVVFLDVELGGQNGMEECLRIKDDPRLADIPVVLVSGHGQEVLRREALLCRADAYVQKPVKPGDLLRLAEHYASPWGVA